jgi:hypothetical protein
MKQNGAELDDFEIPSYQKAIENLYLLKSVELVSV